MTTGTNPPESWLNDLFEQTPDGVVLLEEGGRILRANSALARIFSISPDALPGALLLELLPAEQRDRWRHDLDKLRQGEWTMVEATLHSAQRRDVSVEINLISRTTIADRPAVLLHLHDISVYRTIERALVASQSQWERSFDAIADCLCILNHTGCLLRANLAFLQRFADRHGDPIGRNYRTFCQTAAERPALPDAVREAPFARDEVTFVHPAGRFNVSAYPLRGDDDSRQGAILVIHDITEQCRTRDALMKNETGLRQAAKMEAIGRLAGGIAHDFNNILTSILGYGALVLRSMQPTDPLREDIQEISRAAERATALTRQLLDFSHERAIETKNVNLNTVIRGMEKFLHRMLGEDVQTHLTLDPQLWLVQADEPRIEQIVMNLAINARDAMTGGGHIAIETGNVTIDTALRVVHPELKAPHYVRLTISDTGQGMPPEVLEHLFEPFFTTKERGKGTGLGLTTIYGIVRQFGGLIACYSEIGKGASFHIYLPQSDAAQTPVTPLATEAPPLPAGSETILVVDDEAQLVGLVAQMLAGLGYRTIRATSSAAAIEAARGAPTLDLLLTDIVMPKTNGIALAENVRQAHPNAKALFMSGYAGKTAIESGLLRPNSNFIQKPFSIDALARLVRTVLDAKPSVNATRRPL